MTPADYDEVIALWNALEGVRPNESREELARILDRNPGLSAVIRTDGQLAAAVLCCHDGRRGYLYHLGVAATFRRQGLATALVEHCLAGLRAEGIRRCTIFLIRGNAAGAAFWKQTGWRDRSDLEVFARDL
jgi:ribosomal protein S18 acetylase RimI-like enzyme